MKRTIRRGVFETNSSSVHSIVMCSESDYDRWQKGELVYDKWGDELVEITDDVKKSREENEKIYLTYEEFNDWDYLDYETFEETYVPKFGEKIIAFGYYGHD